MGSRSAYICAPLFTGRVQGSFVENYWIVLAFCRIYKYREYGKIAIDRIFITCKEEFDDADEKLLSMVAAAEVIGSLFTGCDGTAGLTWEDPAATYVKNGAPVKIVFPKEGAILPVESVRIIKD